jgi:probable LLM family oxidoreductase
MQIGIDTFVATPYDPALRDAETDMRRVEGLLQEVELADQVGLDVYAIGEHHRREYVSSAPAMLLAAAAARTQRIRLASAVNVLSSDDPIRVFQQFATLDLISKGRAEIVVGRGSFIESYPLFGYDLDQYDLLFAEKLDLLLAVRDKVEVHWSGTHRAPLTGQGVYPRPLQNPLPIRLGVGGTPASFVRAGKLGLPLTLAIIGGEPARFRPAVDLYRRAWREAGHDPALADVAVHTIGFVADTDDLAAEQFYPSYFDTISRIGRERGWSPPSRAQFDAARGPQGSLMVGSPETVAAKARAMNVDLGGISRLSVLVDGGIIPHDRLLHAVELLGTGVKPRVATTAGSTVIR